MPKRLGLILGRLILTQRISAKNVIDFHNGYGQGCIAKILTRGAL